MLRTLRHPHLRPVLRSFKVTTAGSTSTVDIGAGQVSSATRNSAGQSTLSAARPNIRAGVVVGSVGNAVANGGYVTYQSDPTASSLVMRSVGAGGLGDDGTLYALALDWMNEYTDRVSPLQTVTARQRCPRLMGVKVSAAGAMSIGAGIATVSNASSVYTVTFNNAFGRTCIAVASPIAAAQKAVSINSTSASQFVAATFDVSEAAENNKFYAMILGWDASDEQFSSEKAVQVPGLKPRLEAFRIDISGGTPTIAIGTTDAAITDDGTGVFTLTWTKSFAREPIVIPTGKTLRAQPLSDATTTSVQIGSFNAAGVATDDTGVSVLVLGYDSSMEI